MLYVVWNKLNKELRVFKLDIKHLLIYFFCTHSSSEDSWAG